MSKADAPLVQWAGECGRCGHAITRTIRGRTENEDKLVWVECSECEHITPLWDADQPSTGEVLVGP